MKITTIMPPREFAVGQDCEITLKDCARVELAPNEQITLTTDSKTEFDITRKSWGYYATPSLNKRLSRFNLRGVLTRGADGDTFYLLLVERGKEDEFASYLSETGMHVVCWLDSDEAFGVLQTNMGAVN